MSLKPAVLITGASTGIGAVCADRFTRSRSTSDASQFHASPRGRALRLRLLARPLQDPDQGHDQSRPKC
jgi:NAD(P)-dependent dehydrogenase (short-subunit alcohol dehydrogenase family)